MITNTNILKTSFKYFIRYLESSLMKREQIQ